MTGRVVNGGSGPREKYSPSSMISTLNCLEFLCAAALGNLRNYFFGPPPVPALLATFPCLEHSATRAKSAKVISVEQSENRQAADAATALKTAAPEHRFSPTEKREA